MEDRSGRSGGILRQTRVGASEPLGGRQVGRLPERPRDRPQGKDPILSPCCEKGVSAPAAVAPTRISTLRRASSAGGLELDPMGLGDPLRGVEDLNAHEVAVLVVVENHALFTLRGKDGALEVATRLTPAQRNSLKTPNIPLPRAVRTLASPTAPA